MPEPIRIAAINPNQRSGEHVISRNQRRAARVTVSLPVVVETTGEDLVGIATDLWLGGMFVSSTDTLAYGTRVNVRLERPDVGQEMCLPGIVRWLTELGFGVQFGALRARDTHELAWLLASLRTTEKYSGNEHVR